MDGRGSREGIAAGRGTAAADQRRGDGGAGSTGRGAEEEGAGGVGRGETAGMGAECGGSGGPPLPLIALELLAPNAHDATTVVCSACGHRGELNNVCVKRAAGVPGEREVFNAAGACSAATAATCKLSHVYPCKGRVKKSCKSTTGDRQ